MKQRYMFVIAALAMVAVLGIGTVSAFGFNGFFNKAITDEDKNALQEEMISMQTAIENKDYASWKSLMEAQIARMQEQITEENFNAIVNQQEQMSEMRTAMEEVRTQYCGEHDCPLKDDSNMHFRMKGEFRNKPLNPSE